jgi:hypothetical protein
MCQLLGWDDDSLDKVIPEVVEACRESPPQ